MASKQEFCKNGHDMSVTRGVNKSGSYCTVCAKEAKARYRANNKEKIALGNRAWLEKNRDKHEAAAKRFRENNPDKIKAYNKKCKAKHVKEYSKARMEWRRANAAKDRETAKRFRLNNPEKCKMGSRKANLKRKYGLTLEEYDLMVAQREGKCDICKKIWPGKKLYVDHCHTTNVVRGLLCYKCNTVLGFLSDDKNLFIRAMEYLSKPGRPIKNS